MTVKDVEKIAALSKLSFSSEEKKRYTRDLAQIVSYVEKLNELNTSDVEPTSHVVDLKNVLRHDQAESWFNQKKALQNAPKSKTGFFSVPEVIGSI